MTPQGPYSSPWSTGKWWLIKTQRHGETVLAFVKDGVQPTDAQLIFCKKADATAWISDNGYKTIS